MAKKPYEAGVKASPDPKKVAARFMLEAMSNLPPKDTGVAGVVICVSSGEFAGTESQHGPRVKVMPGTKVTREGLEDAVSVTITTPPRVIGTLPGKVRKEVVEFVNVNREILLRYWNNDASTREMLEGLTRVQ
jgi:hypothetical protein